MSSSKIQVVKNPGVECYMCSILNSFNVIGFTDMLDKYDDELSSVVKYNDINDLKLNLGFTGINDPEEFFTKLMERWDEIYNGSGSPADKFKIKFQENIGRSGQVRDYIQYTVPIGTNFQYLAFPRETNEFMVFHFIEPISYDNFTFLIQNFTIFKSIANVNRSDTNIRSSAHYFMTFQRGDSYYKIDNGVVSISEKVFRSYKIYLSFFIKVSIISES